MRKQSKQQKQLVLLEQLERSLEKGERTKVLSYISYFDSLPGEKSSITGNKDQNKALPKSYKIIIKTILNTLQNISSSSLSSHITESASPNPSYVYGLQPSNLPNATQQKNISYLSTRDDADGSLKKKVLVCFEFIMRIVMSNDELVMVKVVDRYVLPCFLQIIKLQSDAPCSILSSMNNILKQSLNTTDSISIRNKNARIPKIIRHFCRQTLIFLSSRHPGSQYSPSLYAKIVTKQSITCSKFVYYQKQKIEEILREKDGAYSKKLIFHDKRASQSSLSANQRSLKNSASSKKYSQDYHSILRSSLQSKQSIADCCQIQVSKRQGGRISGKRQFEQKKNDRKSLNPNVQKIKTESISVPNQSNNQSSQIQLKLSKFDNSQNSDKLQNSNRRFEDSYTEQSNEKQKLNPIQLYQFTNVQQIPIQSSQSIELINGRQKYFMEQFEGKKLEFESIFDCEHFLDLRKEDKKMFQKNCLNLKQKTIQTSLGTLNISIQPAHYGNASKPFQKDFFFFITIFTKSKLEIMSPNSQLVSFYKQDINETVLKVCFLRLLLEQKSTKIVIKIGNDQILIPFTFIDLLQNENFESPDCYELNNKQKHETTFRLDRQVCNRINSISTCFGLSNVSLLKEYEQMLSSFSYLGNQIIISIQKQQKLNVYKLTVYFESGLEKQFKQFSKFVQILIKQMKECLQISGELRKTQLKLVKQQAE